VCEREREKEKEKKRERARKRERERERVCVCVCQQLLRGLERHRALERHQKERGMKESRVEVEERGGGGSRFAEAFFIAHGEIM